MEKEEKEPRLLYVSLKEGVSVKEDRTGIILFELFT